MRILVVGPQSPDSFARNISVTLRAMQHTVMDHELSRAYHLQNRFVRRFQTYAPLVFPSIERRAYEKLITAVERAAFELLFFTYAIPPEVIDRLREISSAPMVCWFPDSLINFYRGHMVADRFDALFLKEPALIGKLRQHLEINAHYLPEACNPMWHTPVELSDEDRQRYSCEIAGIGTLHYYRARVLEPLQQYDLKIWGSNRPRWLVSPVSRNYAGAAVVELEKSKALRVAKIVVNVIHYSEIEGVNNSLFEIAGCGAFQIASWQRSIPEIFDVGREIVTFESRSELLDKVRYYLAHQEERNEIAYNGQQRAHRDHTYEQRLNTILRTVGLLKPV